MLLLTITTLIAFSLTNIIMTLAYTLSKKKMIMINKTNPFECGFTPYSNSRMPMSLHFFFITLLFLIFDVEITLILPMILTMKLSNMFYWSIMCMYFFLLLIIGLMYEWNQMLINWIN